MHGTQPSRVLDVFLRYLRAEGVSVVYGIPGGLLHPFFEGVQEAPELRLVVAKHEQGAAFMADGFARASNQLAVCAGTSGPGATNLITGVACAYADGVPLLVLTGQAARHTMGKGAAQETNREDIDIVEMFRPITKYSAMVTSAASLPHHLRRALRAALTGRRGPVHLNVPVDVWTAPLHEDWLDPETYRPLAQPLDPRAVRRAATLLLDATRPVLLAGSGVHAAGAENSLRALAARLPAAVASTPRAKGVFPENHPLALGVMGIAGHEPARQTLLGDDVDVMLAVGASFNETTTLNWTPRLRPSKALLHCDIDPERIGRNYPVQVPLVGDARAVLDALREEVDALVHDGAPARSEWQPSALPSTGLRYGDTSLRDDAERVPLAPQRWRVELQAVLPDDAIVVSDIGGHMLFNLHHLAMRAQQRFLINMNFGSMGHGVCAAVGAAMAQPRRTVVSIVGDACFTMNGMELLTAAEYEVPVIWLVENNQMHGITFHGSQLVGSRVPLHSVRYRRELDVAAMARAMGLHAQVVSRPGELGPAMHEAMAAEGPSVIEIRVDPTLPPPLGDRAKSIAGFIEG